MIKKNKKIYFYLLLIFFITIYFQLRIYSQSSTFDVIKVYESEKDFNSPESFQFDPVENSYFISNINGQPSSKDNNGYIMKLDKDFKIINKYFIKSTDNYSLNAPKGISIYKNILAVTDIDQVKYFDKTTGKFIKSFNLKKYGAKFLNDCVFDISGNLYISDTSSNIIFKISSDNKIEKYINIISPNGLCYLDNALYIVTWNKGKIYKVKNKIVSELKFNKKFGNLDGIDYIDKNTIIISDFTNGNIFIINLNTNKIIKIIKGLKNPADISFDHKNSLILVPQFNRGIAVFKLSKLK